MQCGKINRQHLNSSILTFLSRHETGPSTTIYLTEKFARISVNHSELEVRNILYTYLSNLNLNINVTI